MGVAVRRRDRRPRCRRSVPSRSAVPAAARTADQLDPGIGARPGSAPARSRAQTPPPHPPMARAAARVGARRANPVGRFDLRDLELLLRSARHVDGDHPRPRLWPIRALPIGTSCESFCSAGSASVGPTIWNLRDSPDLVLPCTRTPTPTLSVLIAFSSTTLARRNRSSSCAIRARAGPARSWRRRTRSSRRCRRTPAPP